jgi:hypothetical protein
MLNTHFATHVMPPYKCTLKRLKWFTVSAMFQKHEIPMYYFHLMHTMTWGDEMPLSTYV